MPTSKKQSLFDQFFNRTFETIQPQKGLDPIRIDSSSIANIPGIIEHWGKELENRKEAILEFENRNFFEMFFDWLGGDEEFEDASGDELLKISPSEETKDLVETLEKDPSDMTSRLDLVSHIFSKSGDLPIEALRDLYLQASVACCFGKLSNTGLMIVLKTQQAYFSKLKIICDLDLKKLKKLLAVAKKNDLYDKQRKVIVDYQNRIVSNQKLIDFYLKYTMQGINSLQTSFSLTLSIDEIRELKTFFGKPGNQQKMKLFNKAALILTTIRYLPLLHQEAQKYINLLEKVEPQNPLSEYLKARLHRTKLLFLIKQFETDSSEPVAVDTIKDRFKLSYQAYTNAIKAMQVLPKNDVSAMAYHEFAKLIVDFYLFSKNRLRTSLPGFSPVFYLNKAELALESIQSRKGVKELLDDIRYYRSEFISGEFS